MKPALLTATLASDGILITLGLLAARQAITRRLDPTSAPPLTAGGPGTSCHRTVAGTAQSGVCALD